MQMYKVSFRDVRGALVETGEFLVCAQNAEAAEALVSGYAHVSSASAAFEVHRVKPSIYELSRSEFVKSELPAFIAEKEPGAVHETRVSAKVFAFSEPSVLRRLAKALIGHASANREQPKHVNDLSIEIERADHRPAPSRVEQQAIYKERRLFPGGAARPR